MSFLSPASVSSLFRLLVYFFKKKKKRYQTFKDRDCLYFLLEVALGGELFLILRNRTCFDTPTSQFFAGSVVLAFEYMHDKKIIYRDLKPENLLIDNRGYLKVTDFGFAKEVTDR